MEAYKKVKKYLHTHIGNMTTPGRPIFNSAKEQWKVPVLCKTSRGMLLVGEFILDKDLNYIYAPTREEMQRILDAEKSRVPMLVYSTEEELLEKGIQPVQL